MQRWAQVCGTQNLQNLGNFLKGKENETACTEISRFHGSEDSWKYRVPKFKTSSVSPESTSDYVSELLDSESKNLSL